MEFSLLNNGEYELSTRYDHAQSFYNKASVVIKSRRGGGFTVTLRSYLTPICRLQCNGGEVVGGVRWLNGDPADWSNTTWRHIREFLRQAGFRAVSKAQCLRDYCKKEV